MTDFMGLSLIVTGMVIVAISLFNSRHSASKNLDAIRHGLSNKQIDKIFKLGPSELTQILDCISDFSSLPWGQ